MFWKGMMFWRKIHIQEYPGYKKNLREYTNEELIEYLNQNNDLPLEFLTGICSEVLRRFVGGRLDD